MARKKNSFLRKIIPLAAILGGVGVVAAVAVNSANQSKSPQAPAVAEASDRADAGVDAAPSEPAGAEPVSTAEPEPARLPETGAAASAEDTGIAGDGETEEGMTGGVPVAPVPAEDAAEPVSPAGLRARVFDDVAPAAPLGSLDGVDGHHIYVEFSRYGAGISSLQLGEGFFADVESTEHVELQAQRTVQRPGLTDLTAVPFAALAIEINGEAVGLASPGVWRHIEGEPGAFEAIVEDGSGNDVLRLERRFDLLPGTFRLEMARLTENLTGEPLSVRWFETGPIDLPVPEMGYGGDKRRIRFGYLLNPKMQAGSETVTDDGDLKGRHKVLGKKTKDLNGFSKYAADEPIWPTPASDKNGQRLVWSAFTGRYFAVALHPLFDPASVLPGGEAKLFKGVERMDRLVLNPYSVDKQGKETVMVMRVTTARETVGAGESASLTTGLYAGPLLSDHLAADDLSRSLNLKGLIAYNFGGMCGEMCTFGWLTHILFFVLSAAHSLTFDWAASIIILVLIVRTALHPITRWSQIRLQRFSKQMSGLAPKQAKLREKYKDDQKKMQSEMARLWKEEGINPAGALGCLPMFLQSPVWIALYATLYFAAEMRHEPGFWGVFQTISGGNWRFLADLSSPDAALPLPGFMHFTPPILGTIYGRIESINLLPILMGVLFFAHQKFLSPPPSASMTPEQESQQKLMRVMFPLMMPIFMYTAPSGLCVYFITNSALAIIENKHIRSSAEKQGLLDPEKIKAEKMARRAAGKGGFMTRLQQLAEERQKAQAGQGGKKQVQNVAKAGKPEAKPRNYKKRK